MKTEKKDFKIVLERKQTELSTKIIQGTAQTDENGEFTYSLEDLYDLCQLNKLTEITDK